jgi:Flp pilus assembly protein TadG
MKTIKDKNRKQKGVAAVITALSLIALLGVAAFSVDIATYFLRNNELQNAADAGALAGARVLYDYINNIVNAGGFINEDGHQIPSANQVAHDTAVANVAQNTAVEVVMEGVNDNHNDVRRGHWSFSTRTFTPSDATDPIQLVNFTYDELDVFMPDNPFINAVEVTTRRQATPLVSFFSRIFGNSGLEMKAKAIAYLGFSGQLLPGEADLPIVICEDSILVDGVFRCNIGRMINSGTNLASNDTGRWTSFESTDQCRENVNVTNNEVNDLISCDNDVGGNPNTIYFGEGLATNNGEMNPLSAIEECFLNRPGSVQDLGIFHMWQMRLPVGHCTSDPGCAIIVGAVSLYVTWVNYNQPESHYEIVPKFMYAPTDADGNPILDEYGDEIYLNWPGDTYGTYNNVEAVWTEAEGDLIPFMLDLYNYYKSTNRGDYINIGDEITAAYGEGWQTDPSIVGSFFVEGDMIGDPNSVEEADIDGKVRWASFIYHWGLENIDEDEFGNVTRYPAPWNGNAIYFLPSCDVVVPSGVTGGKNYGILAKVPVLVD